jgi:2-keto-3-deoxy-L-rhamnonate aldolase RhmA
LSAAKQIADDTLAAGKIFGTLVFDGEHSKFMQDAGAKLIIHGADIIYYKHAYTKLLEGYGRS